MVGDKRYAVLEMVVIVCFSLGLAIGRVLATEPVIQEFRNRIVTCSKRKVWIRGIYPSHFP